ncbi:MAG: tetratricopeptide repeat protein [Anaerolineae bacterium]|nr:tetratricopeptide repeat protein [Anaerolineae bacterium]
MVGLTLLSALPGRRQGQETVPGKEGYQPQARPLRVLIVLPRPLVMLYNEKGGPCVTAGGWNPFSGAGRVLPPRRGWEKEALEDALRQTAAPLAVQFLRRATESALRRALAAGYDVIFIDTCSEPDGALHMEGPDGESLLLSPSDLGPSLAESGMQLAILSTRHAAACKALCEAGKMAGIGMSDSIPPEAARAYLVQVLAALARGARIKEAHAQGGRVLRDQWSIRPRRTEYPWLVVPRRLRRRTLVQAAEGGYRSLADEIDSPAPPHPAGQVPGRELDQVLVQYKLLARTLPEGTVPLVTLVGIEGEGKTALAQTVAHWFWERAILAKGILFVSLVGLRVAGGETAADRLAAVLDLPRPRRAPGEDVHSTKVESLCSVLAEGKRLLVLDHFENAAADKRNLVLLQKLIQHCPNLYILVTNQRAPLELEGERVHWLEPPAEAAAVALFCEQVAGLGKEIAAADRPAVAEICRLVARVPLHVRMVARDVRTTPPAEILAGLQDIAQRYHLVDIDLFEQAPHLQGRKIAFHYVYDRLGADEQRLWVAIATVFASAPDRQAVRAICGEEASAALDVLLDWQIVEETAGQLQMIKALREFGQEQLETGVIGIDRGALVAHHAAYYLAYAETWRRDPAALERELVNILAGFQHVANPATRDDAAVVAYTWAMLDFFRARDLWEKALDWLDAAYQACETLDDQTGMAMAYANMGKILYLGGNDNVALSRFHRSLEIYRQLDDQAGLAATYENIGEVHRARGDLNAALTWYEQSQAVYEAMADQDSVAAIYGKLGSTHHALGDHRTAMQWYERSAAIWEATDNQVGLARSYNNIGLICRARGDYDAALQWYKQSAAIRETLDDAKGLAVTYTNIADIYYARGKYDPALEWYERSVAVRQRLGDRVGLAMVYAQIGLIHRAHGDYCAALNWHQRSMALQEALGDRRGLAAVYGEIGLIHKALGDYRAAMEWYERSAAIWQELDDAAGMGEAIFNRGLVYMSQRDFTSALELFTRSRALYSKAGAQEGLARVEEMIAQVQRRLGEGPRA